MKKLKPSKSYSVGKTQNHGRWITNKELEEIIYQAQDVAIARTCRQMTIVALTVLKKHLWYLFRHPDKRIAFWCSKSIEYMSLSTKPNEDMIEAELEMVKEVPIWKKSY